jgi:hypothetical protein
MKKLTYLFIAALLQTPFLQPAMSEVQEGDLPNLFREP